MIYTISTATTVFFGIISVLAILISLLPRHLKTTYLAHWTTNLAVAGDHISAALFVGICGSIAFYGYDGFLYAIGIVGGVMVLRYFNRGKMRGDPTFHQTLISRFPSRRIKRMLAISTLVCGTFLLVPQVVAAMAVLRPLGIGIPLAVLLLVMGLVSPVTRNGASLGAAPILLLILVAAALGFSVMRRGFQVKSENGFARRLSSAAFQARLQPGDSVLPNTGSWSARHYVRVRHPDGSLSVWSFAGMQRLQLDWPAATFTECQLMTVTPAGKILVNGLPPSAQRAAGGGSGGDLRPMGFVQRLSNGSSTGPLGPFSFLAAIQQADVAMPRAEKFADDTGRETVYYSAVTAGEDVLAAGNDPMLFPALRSGGLRDRLNFISFVLALLLGAAATRMYFSPPSLDPADRHKRPATPGFLGMTAIAAFYLLAIFVGLGAMTSGALDPTSTNLAFPLLANSFGGGWLAVSSAIFFFAILTAIADTLRSTARGLPPHANRSFILIMIAAAIPLAILLQKINVAFLLTWFFGVAASTHLPALTLGLSWKRATPAGVTASILVGLVSSVVWIVLSREAGFVELTPFNQPALVTLPLSFITLVVVSLLCPKEAAVNSQG